MTSHHSNKFVPTSKDLRYYRIFPVTAGTVWFVTLLTLLVYWLASERPLYAGQRNPYVAFISDIGAFALQPLFIAGGTISAGSFLGTICAVHFTLHWRCLRGKEALQQRYRKVVSILACLFQLAGCPCQLALTVFDNHGHPRVHWVLLFLALMGTALSAICTIVAFWDMMKKENTKGNELLRRSVIISNFLFVVDVCFGIAFTALLSVGFYRTSGILQVIYLSPYLISSPAPVFGSQDDFKFTELLANISQVIFRSERQR